MSKYHGLVTLEYFEGSRFKGLYSSACEAIARQAVKPKGTEERTGNALYSETDLIIAAGQLVLDRARAVLESLPPTQRASADWPSERACSPRHIFARGTHYRPPVAFHRQALYFPS